MDRRTVENAILNEHLQKLWDKKEQLNLGIDEDTNLIISENSCFLNIIQDLIKFITEFCTDEEIKEKVMNEFEKMKNFTTFDMLFVDKWIKEISVNCIESYYQVIDN